MAIHQLALVIPQMHTATTAELPHFALLALLRFSPLAVAEWLESILPYIPEAIAVDIALCIVAAHACAARDIAINANGGYRNASIAHIEVVAHLRLVTTEETLAGIT